MDQPPDMNAPPAAPPTVPTPPVRPPGMPDPNDTTMAMLCHLLALFTGFIGPLVIWLIQREQSRFVDAHGREVLNFVFTMMIAFFGLAILAVCGGVLTPITGGISLVASCIAYAALLGLAIYELIIIILGCVEASRGGFRPYPLRIAFLRPVDPYGP